jgi:RHS repeat-associated protein
MAPESFQLSATTPTRFLSKDGRLEIDVPVGAVTASDIAGDGGSSSLTVSQTMPGSGSNAGGSGHFTYGTYELQTLDAKGQPSKHGLRAAVTLKLHFGSQGVGLDPSNSFVILDGAYAGNLVSKSPIGSAANRVPTTIPTAFDPVTQTIAASVSMATPLSVASFGTNSSSVATFGKPQPFEADLGGSALTSTYPLDLQGGPAGFAPPLALAYNSAGVSDQHNAQGGVGWVGEGWNLSMGAISWGEHYVADAGGTNWQDSWQLSDPYGTGVDLIPPSTSTAIYQEDSGHTITTTPVQWQTNPEIYAKIYSFQSGLTIAGNPTPPCWRVFLTNGIMEEFGCTTDSLEYYPNSAGKAYIYSWLLDMIVDTYGNQIHVTYNRDMETLNSLSYPRDAVMNTVEWDSPTCTSTSTICSTSGTAPNLWEPLLRVRFSSAHAVTRSPSGSSNCGVANGNLRCDDPVAKSGGVGAPSVQNDFVLNDIFTEVCNSGCSSQTPTWNQLKDYQLGYDQSGPGTLSVDPISGKAESTAGKLDLTQIAVFGDDHSTTLPITNFGYTKEVEYYEDSIFFPASSTVGLCSFSACPNGNGSTNCGLSFNTGYTPNNHGCVLWSESFDGNSYYMTSASNGIGLSETFSWVNLRSNVHGTDWWDGHNNGGNTSINCTNPNPPAACNVWKLGYNPLECNTNQTTIYPCDMTDDEAWSRIGLASRTESLVRLTQSGQGGTQSSTPVNGTTSYVYQNVFPNAVQLCPLHTSNNFPSACVAGVTWGSGYDNDYLDFYNGVFMGFTQVQVTNPDGSVEAHKFYSAEGWGGWGVNNAQGGTVGLSIICPYSAQSNPPSIDTCWSDPYWDIANQTNYPGQANGLHGREYEVDRYDMNGTTLLEQTKTQFAPTCTPPIIPAGSQSVSGYTNNGWGGNLVSSLDLGNPEVPCDVQTTQVDDYTFDGASGTVPDKTTTYSYETGSRPCSTCFGREIKVTTASNDGAGNSNPTTIVNASSYVWNDNVNTGAVPVSGSYLISFAASTDTEESNGTRHQCTFTSYDGQAYVTGQSSGLVHGRAGEVDRYFTTCGTAPSTSSGLIASKYGFDSFGNRLWSIDPDGHVSPGCTAGGAQRSACQTTDGYFEALNTQQANALNQTTSTGYQSPSSGTAASGFGLWPMSTTDENSQTTSFTYDALGRQTSTTLPGEGSGLTTTTSTYTVWCSGTAAQIPCAEIDTSQRLNSTTIVTSRTFYDGIGNVIETRSAGPSGDIVQYANYDPSQRMVFKSIAYIVTAYSGGPGSAAFSIPDSTVAGTTYAYDGLGRTKSVTDPLTSTTNTQYSVVCNASGTGDTACYEQTMTTDPLSHQSGVLTDALGRVNYEQRYTGNSGSSYALYATAKYTYDYLGDQTKILQPDGASTTTYGFDLAGRRIGMTDADRGVEIYSYDADGNLTESIDARGSSGTIFVGFDALDRPVWRNTTNSPSGAYDTYTYDSTAGGNVGIGRLTSETFSGGGLSGSDSYAYDSRGRQTSSTLVVGSTSYPISSMTYNDAGQLTAETYPDGDVVTNTYSNQDWLAGVSTQFTSVINTIAYTGPGGAVGRMTSASIVGAYSLSDSYDLLARPTEIKVTKTSDGTIRFDQVRTFDGTGNVSTAATTLAAGTDNQAFCYDEQNRLTWAGAVGTPPCTNVAITAGTLTAAQYTQTFAYDNMGRFTTGPLGAYTYGDSAHVHALTHSAAYTAAYDAAGNMTCRAPTTSATCISTQTGAQLSYNNEGQLSNWQNQPSSPTSTAAFLYDGQGNRVAQQTTSSGSATTTVYVGELEEDSTTDGTTTKTSYYYANGIRVAMASNGNVHEVVTDGIGSTTLLLSTSGATTTAALYVPYGKARYTAGDFSLTDYGFTGQHVDSTSSLEYFGSRYYDRAAGQFTSADTIVPGNGYDIWGLSRFAYVEGNPIINTDPGGHAQVCDCGDDTTNSGNPSAVTTAQPTAATKHSIPNVCSRPTSCLGCRLCSMAVNPRMNDNYLQWQENEGTVQLKGNGAPAVMEVPCGAGVCLSVSSALGTTGGQTVGRTGGGAAAALLLLALMASKLPPMIDPDGKPFDPNKRQEGTPGTLVPGQLPPLPGGNDLDPKHRAAFVILQILRILKNMFDPTGS